MASTSPADASPDRSESGVGVRIVQAINRMSEWTGRLVYGLTLVMVIVGAFNAVTRYLDRYTGFGLSSNLWLELQWYLFSLVFLIGAAYTLKRDDHVRVDVLYGRLSRRGQAWINLLGTLLFLVPFCVLVLWMSIPFVEQSWAVLEQSSDPGGLPRYPIKTVIPLAFVLVLLQGLSLALRETLVLMGAAPAAWAASTEDGDALDPDAPAAGDDRPSGDDRPGGA
jgi:TRAP-type mannitol/chloroaromatic compound transport system permease small subunit